jgi:hypothetical protein
MPLITIFLYLQEVYGIRDNSPSWRIRRQPKIGNKIPKKVSGAVQVVILSPQEADLAKDMVVHQRAAETLNGLNLAKRPWPAPF